ncbi:hypothetical protein [Bacillus sp. UNC41MFS5]|nr:hypothetical protein [Bacillus sp. UNC41MFS5]
MLWLKWIGIVGTPYAVKAACTVWTGEKGSDNFKPLPICIMIGLLR